MSQEFVISILLNFIQKKGLVISYQSFKERYVNKN